MQTAIMLEPLRIWSMRPAVTIGPIPSSINVPLLEANMTLIAPRGSSAPPCPTPRSGTSLIIKYNINASAVQRSFSLKVIFRSGFLISGKKLMRGLNNSMNLGKASPSL